MSTNDFTAEGLTGAESIDFLRDGRIDCLFYTAGLPPRFAPLTGITRDDLQRQLEVHYLGAVAAIGRAAAVMRRQGLGGSIVASVSKAALVPGRDAVAYGGSKAALLQAAGKIYRPGSAPKLKVPVRLVDAIAWHESGTMCCSPIFMREAPRVRCHS